MAHVATEQISTGDWEATPPAVRNVLLSLERERNAFREQLDRLKHTQEAAEFAEVEQSVQGCLAQLRNRDRFLLEKDVSQRAITHKLAEYLQKHFPGRNVDCEYNRNVELGEKHSKDLHLPQKQNRTRQELLRLVDKNAPEEELLAVSTYPDIIVHHRGHNDDNLLVIEVKKTSSTQNSEHDYAKLKGFTQVNGQNNYKYKWGVFILLGTGQNHKVEPELTWFERGAPL